MTTARSAKDGSGQLTSRADSIAGRTPDRSSDRGGRPPSPRADRLRVLLKVIRDDGNLLDCAILDQADNELGTVVAARLSALQARKYDGKTFGGVTYALVDANTRTATDGVNPDENQKVTPDYVVDHSELILARLPAGTGLSDTTNGGRRVVWQSLTHRQWSPE